MTTYVFSGQGAQKSMMGDRLFKKFPKLVREADDILGYSIVELCMESSPKRLNQTQYTQPALYVVNALAYLELYYATARLPNFFIGHSLGEYVALFAANVFDFAQGLKLVKKRGELMSSVVEGGMAAVSGLSASQIETCLRNHNITDVIVANDNSPTQVVISGHKNRLSELDTTLRAAGADLYTPLNVSGPFHSFFMDDAAQAYREYLTNFLFNAAEVPVISNVTARPHNHSEIAENLVQQIRSKVRWVDTMRYLNQHGEQEFIEITAAKKIMEKILQQNNCKKDLTI